MHPAEPMNELGRVCQDKGYLGYARVAYAAASVLAPGWSVPWFNRGLVAKHQRRWKDSRAYNRRAATLAPSDPPAWWNLGIAATALGDWATAREAWSRYGIDVPPGSGPIEMDLGEVPIRVSPAEHPEVVWCRRADPARAIVRSVPTAASGRGCGDTVLHDGAANGHRMLHGREVPVFDELELLVPGSLCTFSVRLVAPTRADLDQLESLSDEEFVVEDWASSVRWLCKKCSEGTPHEHPPRPTGEAGWEPERIVGVAARSEGDARSRITQWVQQVSGRHLEGVECVLQRPDASGR